MSGTGITTRQIKAAPHGAVYVWPTHDLVYPKRLARSLGRDDLRIVSAEWLRSPDVAIKARLTPGVIDHAVIPLGNFTVSQMELIRAAEAIWND